MRTLGRLLNAVACLALIGLGGSASGQVIVAPNGQTASGWLAYRNDTTVQVVLQGSVVLANGTERRGTPHQINPREAAWDQVIGAGPKILTIYDSKGRILSRDTVQFTGKDLFFSIQLDPSTKVTDKNFKTRLVPVPDPRMNAGPVPGFQGMPVLPGGLTGTSPRPTLPGGLNPVMTPGGPVVLPGLPNPTLPGLPR